MDIWIKKEVNEWLIYLLDHFLGILLWCLGMVYTVIVTRGLFSGINVDVIGIDFCIVQGCGSSAYIEVITIRCAG